MTDNCVYVNHGGFLRETENAKLFVINGRHMWIPKSVIDNNDDQIVIIKQWWAKKYNIRSNW